MSTYDACLAEARQLKAILAKWGVKCSIELQGGRGSNPWALPTKYLRMNHHTAAWYRGQGGNLTPALGVVKLGRPDVIGPLANGYGGFDLVYRILCMGLANHPGRGGPIIIDGVRVPEDSARAPTWGTEWEGGFQEWSDIPGMLEFMGRSDCALAEWTGRPITSQLEHSTWAPDRKIDRLHFTRGSGIDLSRAWNVERDGGFLMALSEAKQEAIYQEIVGAPKTSRLGEVTVNTRTAEFNKRIEAALDMQVVEKNSPLRKVVRDEVKAQVAEVNANLKAILDLLQAPPTPPPTT